MSKKVLNDEFLNEPVIGAPDLGDVRQIPMPKTPTEAFLSTPKVETATPAVIDSRFEPKREAKTRRVALTIRPSQHKKLKARAASLGVSVNRVIEVLIEEYLAESDERKPA